MAAMANSAQTAHGHMQDHEGHVRAVEADLEYWRTKRLEPRLIQLHRRGVLTLYDLISAAAHVPAALPAAGEATHDMESRIRALEDGLDEYIRGVALASIDSPDYPFVIEDTRKERGDYDEFFRIAKPPHASTLTERIARLEHDLREYQHLLDVLMRALIDKGVLTMQQLERQRAFLAGRGAWNGARIVARAWVDPVFKQALLTRGREAVRELNIPPGRLGKLGVAENTATLHNVVVCTLCSCYPHDLLGDPPGGIVTILIRSASCATRAARSPIGSTCSCPRASRCASATAPATCAGWCCRAGPRAPTAGARKSWRGSSPSTVSWVPPRP